MGAERTPQQRLAQNRRAIARQLSHGDAADQDTRALGEEIAQAAATGTRRDRGSATWPLLQRALQGWWRHHPANGAAHLAGPLVQAYARERPLQLLGVAAGAGAAVVLLRPWRHTWFARAVGGALGSAELSSLALSLLHPPSKKDPR